jgi:hypothetical protein
MSIRIRTVNGQVVALDAAKSAEKVGDIYIDDRTEKALLAKFGREHREARILFAYDNLDLVIKEENQSALDWWEEAYG